MDSKTKMELIDLFRTNNINNRYEKFIEDSKNGVLNEDEYRQLFNGDILKCQGMVKLDIINTFDSYHIIEELKNINELILG